MSGFLYFLPTSGPTVADFGEGRADVFTRSAGALPGETPSFERAPVLQNGPSGQAGVVLALKSAGYRVPARFGYYPQEQTWQKAPGGEWWLGIENAARPTPEQLARADLCAGHEIKLGDRNLWTVPIARLVSGTSAFPQRLALGPDGKLQVTPMARFDEISKAAEAVWEGMVSGAAEKDGSKVLTIENGWEIAVQALAVNYHLGALEVSALGLLTTISLRQVLLALVDWPTVERLLKAKGEAEKAGRPFGTSDGSGTGSGATA